MQALVDLAYHLSAIQEPQFVTWKESARMGTMFDQGLQFKV
jgi:hypothetical protein